MKQYLDLLKTIKKEGVIKHPARENMPSTQSLFGYQFRHNLKDGFPLLTTKKLSFKNILVELLWFLRGDTNIKFLIKNGCNIWNEDAYNYYLKTFSGNVPASYDTWLKALDSEAGANLGSCGEQYGKLWRKWYSHTEQEYDDRDKCVYDTKIYIDQIYQLIEGLKNNPMSRRHILTAWNPTTLNDMALNACHALVQFNCRPISLSERERIFDKKIGGDLLIKNKNIEAEYLRILDAYNIPKYYLDCQMYQRSADVFLGVPYNIASYALFTHIIAQLCGMEVGDYIHTFGDVHIYENHIEQVDLQLTRECKTLPGLYIDEALGEMIGENYDFTKIDDYFSTMITILDYYPQDRIKAELSTGLKK